MKRLIEAFFTFGMILSILALSLSCMPIQTPSNSKSTSSSNSSLIDLKITDKNLAILNNLDTSDKTFPGLVYSPVSGSPTSYKKLLWTFGSSLDVNYKRPDGIYTQLNDNEGNGWWGECVFAVQALSKSNILAGVKNADGSPSWSRGKRVIDGGIAPGTVIATFTANNGLEFDSSGNSHTAVFKGYVNNGIEVWDQNWDSQNSVNGNGVFGKHYIYTSDSGTSNANNYYVVKINPATTASVSTGTNITNSSLAPGTNIQYGQTVSGTIAKSNDYQDWKFTGQAGDVISITMQQDAAASLKPDMDLRDPSGNLAANGDGWGNSPRPIVNYTLKLSGTYTIHVYGNSSTIGGYQLTLAVKSTGSIMYGQVVKGLVASGGGYQDWNFSGVKGDVITVRMLRDNNVSLNTSVQLFDASSGNELDDGINGNSVGTGDDARFQNYTLPVTGVYIIRASGYNNSTGAYTISLIVNPKPVMLTYGQTAKGTIQLSGGYQDWNFSGVKGDVITVRMLRDNNVSLNTSVQLFDASSGNELDDGINGNSVGTGDDARFENYTLPVTGVYIIRASGYNNTTGAYTISLTKK